jgi:hypothetical protein
VSLFLEGAGVLKLWLVGTRGCKVLALCWAGHSRSEQQCRWPLQRGVRGVVCQPQLGPRAAGRGACRVGWLLAARLGQGQGQGQGQCGAVAGLTTMTGCCVMSCRWRVTEPSLMIIICRGAGGGRLGGEGRRAQGLAGGRRWAPGASSGSRGRAEGVHTGALTASRAWALLLDGRLRLAEAAAAPVRRLRASGAPSTAGAGWPAGTLAPAPAPRCPVTSERAGVISLRGSGGQSTSGRRPAHLPEQRLLQRLPGLSCGRAEGAVLRRSRCHAALCARRRWRGPAPQRLRTASEAVHG